MAERRFNRRTLLQVASGSAALLIADAARGANPQSDNASLPGAVPAIRNRKIGFVLHFTLHTSDFELLPIGFVPHKS